MAISCRRFGAGAGRRLGSGLSLWFNAPTPFLETRHALIPARSAQGR